MNRMFSKMCPALAVLFLLGIVASAWGEAVVYEGFDYEVAPDPDVTYIGGQNGGTGWAGAWQTSWNNPHVKADGLTWGGLTTAGGRLESPGHSGIYRMLDSSLASAGLLNDGATVWFSLIADLDTGRNPQNLTNLDYCVSLGTDQFVCGWGSNDPNGTVDERYTVRYELRNDGEGIGIGQKKVWVDSAWKAQFRTAYWQDDGANDNSAGDGPDGYSNFNLSPQNGWQGIATGTALLVGKIEWGTNGAGETISLYYPDTDLNLGDPVESVTTPDLDQSQFDTLAIYWKDTPGMDELRIGATSDDVLAIQPAQPGDFNSDSQVEQLDLNLLLGNWGASTVPPEWTATFDGLVDQNELNDLLANWGAGVPGADALSGSDVPEPATLGLLLLGGLAGLRRRK